MKIVPFEFSIESNSSFLVFITPLLSGVADYTGLKKTFMKFFCFMGSIATISLYWFDIDNLTFGLFFYFLAMIGFWGSLVFYNSYLPDIAFENQKTQLVQKVTLWVILVVYYY